MHFTPPNYTQTPNVFFDEIMKHLNEGELRVLLIIMRQTFGWHKAEDWITLQLLSKKTGYDRRSICRILERLIEKKLVFKRIEGPNGSQKCYYSLVIEEGEKEGAEETDGVETEEEMNMFKKSYTSDRRVTPPSDRRVTRPVTDGSPTKETNTKETVQKKQQQPPTPYSPSKNQDPISAAAFSDPLKKEQSGPSIFPCLESLDIPKVDKLEISSRYSEQVVKDAVVWALQQKSYSKGLTAAIKFACNHQIVYKKPTPPKTPYQKVCEIFKDDQVYNQATCVLKKEHIAFYRGMKIKELKFDQYFSLERLKELCDDFGIAFTLPRIAP
jgi:phage replication O-like protein O